MKILFLVRSRGKIVPCFSQPVLGVSQASGCSSPWDAFGPHTQGTEKCRAFFCLRKNFLTVADFRAMVMSDLWRLSSCFIWTILIAEGLFFFPFSSSFTVAPCLTLQSHCAILIFWQTIKNWPFPTKVTKHPKNAQAVPFESFYFQDTNYWNRRLFTSTNLSGTNPAMHDATEFMLVGCSKLFGHGTKFSWKKKEFTTVYLD